MATYYVPSETGWRDVNGNYQYVRLKVDQTYTSSTNKSALSITLQFQGPADSTWRAVSTAVDHYVKVKGSNDSESTFDPGGKGFVNNSSSGAWVNLTDSSWNAVSPYTYTVTHNADGTASVSFTVKMLVGSSWRGGDGQTGTLSLSNTPTYTLSISAGTGSSITVKKGTTTLSNGATIARGDSLTITFTASTGYDIVTHTVNGSTFTSGGTHTVTGAVSVVSTAAKKTYTVSYNKGSNGSGTNTSDTKTYDVALTLKGAIFSRTGYTQTGWSTTDGGAKAYNLSASYTTNAAVTLYPFWTINTYTVSYAANGGSSTPNSQTKTYGVALTLASAISRANASAGSYTVTLNANGGSVNPASKSAARTTSYAFAGWKSSGGTTYSAGGSYTANEATTMTAQWTSSTSTAAVSLPTPTRTGYTFRFWGTSTSATSGYTGNYTPSDNVTLYAIWQLNSYTLSISAGTGSSITVKRGTTSLANGATIYYGDSLTVTFAASTGYSLATHTVNGTTFTSGNTHTVTGAVSVASTATLITYSLSITTNQGVTLNVIRTASPIGGGANGLLSNGATLYHNDVLSVSYVLAGGYQLDAATVNGSAVSSDPYTITSNMTVIVTAVVGAMVYIGNVAYQAYIGDGTIWKQYQAYIGNGSSWVAY